MQMKRTLTPTAKNATFKEAIGLAWLDFKGETFRRDFDATREAWPVPLGFCRPWARDPHRRDLGKDSEHIPAIPESDIDIAAFQLIDISVSFGD